MEKKKHWVRAQKKKKKKGSKGCASSSRFSRFFPYFSPWELAYFIAGQYLYRRAGLSTCPPTAHHDNVFNHAHVFNWAMSSSSKAEQSTCWTQSSEATDSTPQWLKLLCDAHPEGTEPGPSGACCRAWGLLGQQQLCVFHPKTVEMLDQYQATPSPHATSISSLRMTIRLSPVW